MDTTIEIFLLIGSSFLGLFLGYSLGYISGNKIGLAKGERIGYSKAKKENFKTSLTVGTTLSLKKKKELDHVWIG